MDRALGTLPKSPEDTLSTLESMFNSADLEGDAFVNPDFPEIGAEGSSKMSLKQYVEQFDAETLSKIARIVSVEGVTLVERHTGALFGSIEELNREFQVKNIHQGNIRHFERRLPASRCTSPVAPHRRVPA